MGTIAQEITRIEGGKSGVRTSVNAILQAQGSPQIPANATIDQYEPYIQTIQQGGSGVTIPNFDNSNMLFDHGRLLSIENELYEKFTGYDANATFSYCNVTGTMASKWMKKAIINGINATGNNRVINLSSFCQYANFDTNDRDITVDLSNVTTSSQNINYIVVNMMFNGISGNDDKNTAGDIFLNLLPNDKTIEPPPFRPVMYELNFEGTLRIHAKTTLETSLTFCFFNSGYYTNFSQIGLLHLIPGGSTLSLSLSNLDSTNFLSTFVSDTIAAYTAEEMTNKSITFVLPLAVYNNITQAQHDAAATKNITFSGA